ncbi:MAG: hypothetical protein HN742_08900 [Lentisphaerae bacterium]|jgi:hypothetical protein|nr:hypothetical protein [Lentisphaerota bacterium]MBT4818995.1 hypothetical protein [Lentisphaerota bacterium]MBT5611157.1 hypothetical protein [Lentisphaerota bacterium]MBT7054719.1 hypothetical protein [Lentisphaerota bacterium]MBT7841977.1 hypothetical protein [Lentisphaerota bacterium]
MTMKEAGTIATIGVCIVVSMDLSANEKRGEPIFNEAFNKPTSALKSRGWILEEHTTAVDDNGAKCLEVINTDRERALSCIYVEVEPGKRYSVSCQMKTEGVVSERRRGATVFVEWVDKGKAFVPGGTYPMGKGGTSPWERFDIPSTNIVPESAAFARLYVGLEGTGRAWFRDLVMSEYVSGLALALERPVDKVVLTSSRPHFSWQDIGRNCQLIIAGDTALSENRRSFSVGPNSSVLLPCFLDSGTTWYWQVQESAKSSNPSGQEMYRSEIRSFSIRENAHKWPPILESRYEWSDVPRPTLAARILSDEEMKIEVAIDDEPAEMVSFMDSVLTFKARQSLSGSVHNVTYSFENSRGETFSASDHYSNISPKSRVSCRQGIAYVDDEAFFPVGAYCDPSDDPAEFSGLVEAGFNLAHSYVFEREDAYDSLMDTARLHLNSAEKHNMKIFLGMPRGWIRRQSNQEITTYVASLMTYPALLSWYIMDEPAPQDIGVQEIENAAQVIERIDPFHPSMVAFSTMVAGVSQNARDYIERVDIVGCDPYPLLRRKPFGTVDEWVRNCRKMGGKDKPVWAIIEAFDADYDSGGIKRGRVAQCGPVVKPTYDQMKCQVFLSLSAGADGIVFYWMSRPRYDMKKDAPVVWESICRLVKELRAIEPFMVTPRSHTRLPGNVPEPFRIWARSNGKGETAITLINPLETHQNLRVKMDLSGRRLLDEGEMMPVNDGLYEADFRPYETKVYVVD